MAISTLERRSQTARQLLTTIKQSEHKVVINLRSPDDELGNCYFTQVENDILPISRQLFGVCRGNGFRHKDSWNHFFKSPIAVAMTKKYGFVDYNALADDLLQNYIHTLPVDVVYQAFFSGSLEEEMPGVNGARRMPRLCERLAQEFSRMRNKIPDTQDVSCSIHEMASNLKYFMCYQRPREPITERFSNRSTAGRLPEHGYPLSFAPSRQAVLEIMYDCFRDYV